MRRAAQRQAEQELARAAAELRRAHDQAARLEASLAAARARLDGARRHAPAGQAAAWLAARRYLARLEAEVGDAERAIQAHARENLREAADAQDRAREQHLRASRRREVVERAVARRAAAGRREQERRAEAAADELAQRNWRRET
ncbi:MAG TPA: hypothetical protein VN962_25335 [Polyangia bacterium]|nr:hypothetical protein [Polyangia bacterium]